MLLPECDCIPQPALCRSIYPQAKAMTQLIIHDDIDIFLPQRFPDVRDDLLHGRKTGRVIPPDPGKYSKPLVLLVNLKLPVQAIDGEDGGGLGRLCLWQQSL